MKFFIVFAAILATTTANPGVVNTGHSAQFRSQDSLGNYAFGYNEDHATGGTFRRETGSPGIAQGSYGLRTIDGRVRVVNYVADGLGFRANVQTNEPGVEDQDPASVLINKAAAIVAPYIKPAVAVAAAAPAPLAIQQSIEAPIVQKYEPAPAVIDAAPIVQQRYEQAPIIEQAPIVQQRYEQAPIIEQAPIVQQRYEQAPIIEQAPIVQQRYEPAPIIEQAPIVQQRYEQAPLYQAAPAPAVISTGYTTKTYAAPAPILSEAPVYATKGGVIAGPASLLAGGYRAPLSPALAAKGLSGYPLIKKK